MNARNLVDDATTDSRTPVRDRPITILIAALGLALFIVWELTDKHPVVDLRLFKRRNFTFGALALSLGYGVFFGNVVLLPLWLQQYMGYTATFAGMALAHGKFGRTPWRDLVAPAIDLAREGMPVDWFAGLMIASAARSLARDRDAAALFLEDGQWPPLGSWTAFTEKHLDQKTLASTLEAVGRDGPRALYGGEVGAALAKDVRDKGMKKMMDDPRMKALSDMPFDGKRLIYGGFEVLVER